ncbi:MAG: hypothetical protein ACFB3T_00150 [Geminicoccaceae bacterium]
MSLVDKPLLVRAPDGTTYQVPTGKPIVVLMRGDAIGSHVWGFEGAFATRDAAEATIDKLHDRFPGVPVVMRVAERSSFGAYLPDAEDWEVNDLAADARTMADDDDSFDWDD